MNQTAVARPAAKGRNVAMASWSDYLELTKPGIGSMVMVTAGVGAAMAGQGAAASATIAPIVVATGLLAAGAGVLNHWMERESDKGMRRTARRPLPAGRMPAPIALAFGCVLAATGLIYLYQCGTPLAAMLGLLSLILYVGVYTPLKPVTAWNTVVGAFPGALPILIGWAAVRERLDASAGMLFALLFVWQFPHFLAIAWIYRDDYAAAGLKMFPSSPMGRLYTGLQATSCCCLLLAISLSPPLTRMAGAIYFWGALACGLYFLIYSIVFQMKPTPRRARLLMFSSLIYLPAVLGLLVLNRVVR